MSNSTEAITLDDYFELYAIVYLHFLNSAEPLPELNSESSSKIDHILKVPFNSSYGKVLYWGFYKKAAILFYLMIKNHPLSNGNKRMACYSLGFFFKINNRRLNLSEIDLYKLSKYVAKSNSASYKDVLLIIERKLKQ